MRFLSLRAIFLLGFVVAMPVLALPPVARRIDELLYGAAPSDFGKPPAAAPLTEELTPQKPTGPLAAATHYEEISPATGALAAASLPSAPSLPIAPAAHFEPPLAAAPASPPETKIDEQVINRLHQIRGSLEQLGAEYVIVEAQDNGRYRFHCRMLVDANSRFTRPFEAISFDPLAAGQQVLREVEAWRAAATQPRTASRQY